MTPDLKTEEGRKQTLKSLNLCCLFDLQNAGMDTSKSALVEVERSYVHLRIKPTSERYEQWGFEPLSEVSFSCSRPEFNRSVSINFSGSGSFNNNSIPEYWRTIHAAEALKIWDKICPIIDDYCTKYRMIEEMIREANKQPGEVQPSTK